MADEDKFMGWRDDEPVYASVRIDYDDTRDVRKDVVFTGASKSPEPGHNDHPVKAGYQRKLLIENQSDRNAVTSYLDGEGIDYTTENVSPTSTERGYVEESGPAHGRAGKHAIREGRALDDVKSNSGVDMVDVRRGNNPNRGETFNPNYDKR